MQKGRFGRQDRLINQKNKDVYADKSKISEPTRCKKCTAVYIKGRWTWEKVTENVNESVCPACRRIADNYPAGIIELRGGFFREHREEVINLIKNTEIQEKTAHALERIITMTEKPDVTVVKTTGIHLARRIGEALSRSYKGDYSFQYLDADKGIRVNWER
jgi:NMD protein affecting ribosome stability and mRNA decay